MANRRSGWLLVKADARTLPLAPNTIPFIIAIEETFDVGVDTRTPVDDKDYQVPFRFSGKIDKLTVKVGPVQLTSDEHQIIRHARAGANN